MRHSIQVGLLSALVIVCAVNILVVRYVYVRYDGDMRIVEEFGHRLQAVEAMVNLKDRWEMRTITTEIVLGFGNLSDAETGPLRLDPQTNEVQRFELHVFKEVGHPVGAWVSAWSPHLEMLKFDEFHVALDDESGKIILIARPRAGESIRMRFTVTILEQRFTKN